MTTRRPVCAVFLMAVALSALATSGRAQAPARTSHFPPTDELASFVRAQVGEYSTLGMGLLGHVLARAAGKSYEELLRERILAPLGSLATTTVLDGERRELMVKGHNRELVVVPLYDAPAIAGAGLLKSNAADLLTFVDANAGPPASPQERAFRESHRIQKRLSEELSIGLAWQISTLGGGESIVMHAGGTGGFQSFIGFAPNKHVGAVLIITRSGTRSDVLDIGTHSTS